MTKDCRLSSLVCIHDIALELWWDSFGGLVGDYSELLDLIEALQRMEVQRDDLS